MIPNSTIDRVQTGDLGGYKIDMVVDENSTAQLMSVLTDLYSDPEETVIREYSVNGLDAHVEAGNPDPIEVLTPSQFAPFLVIKDQGVGMSLEDIERNFSRYLASTKRETNGQVGMLGLGSKSGLTYTSQFTFASVKNGIKSVVSVSRCEDGRGVVEVVENGPTDEPNGTTVTIPARNHSSMHAKAEKFFSFWKPGTVLLNGTEPKHVTGLRISDDMLLAPSGQDYIVMGNVPYALHGERISSSYGYSVVAWVNIGDIDFTPSREQVHYTQRTLAVIKELRNKFEENLRETVTAKVAGAPDYPTAIREYHALLKQLPAGASSILGPTTYRGEEIPKYIEVSDSYSHHNGVVFRPNAHRYQVGAASPRYSYSDFTNEATAYVIGWNPNNEKVTNAQRRRLRAYPYGKTVNRIFLLREMPALPWTADLATVSWESVLALKLPRSPREKSTASGGQQWNVFDPARRVAMPVDKVDTTKPVVYCTTAENYGNGLLLKLADDYTVVVANRNRWARLEREFNAKHLSLMVSKAFKAARDALTFEDLVHATLRTHREFFARYLDPDKISDPELAKYVRWCRDSHTSPALEKYDRLCSLPIGLNTPALPNVLVSPIEHYPLLADCRQHNVEHCYLYIDAVYAKFGPVQLKRRDN